MKVSAIVITNRQDDAVMTALESLAAQEHRPLELVLFGNGAELPEPPGLREQGLEIVTGSSPVNLGVAGGRNAAARLATGDALLFLDDDAVLRPRAVTNALDELTGDVGGVAFQVVDPHTQRIALWLYPLDVEEWGHRTFDAPHFVGGACLVRRDVFEQLDGLWEGYFREMEEIDFCWRMLSAGWRVRYRHDAVAEHPERVDRRLYGFAVPTNVAMVTRLLPPGLAARQSLVKVPLMGIRAARHGELGDFFRGVRATPALVARARRESARLDPDTVEHLRSLHANEGWGKRLQWSLRPRRLPDLSAS